MTGNWTLWTQDSSAPGHFGTSMPKCLDISLAPKHFGTKAFRYRVFSCPRPFAPKHLSSGDCAFPVAAAQTWNSLSTPLTSLSSLPSFSRQLKMELFVRSFPDLGISAYDRIWLTLCSQFCVALAFSDWFSVVRCPCSLFDIMPPKSFLFIIIIITLIPETFRSWDFLFPGTFVPRTFCFQELSFSGLFIPRNSRSQQQLFMGPFVLRLLYVSVIMLFVFRK